MRYIERLQPGKLYHIYNRGVNGSLLFYENRNYDYFINKYNQYCSPSFELYAYSLLTYHFHLLVRVRQPSIIIDEEKKSMRFISASKQLSHFFNCYAQTINKTYDRHGSLLESPCRRLVITTRQDARNLVCYIHQSAERHGLVKDFRDWPYSSWHPLKFPGPGVIMKNEVFELFGSKEAFEQEHRFPVAASKSFCDPNFSQTNRGF